MATTFLLGNSLSPSVCHDSNLYYTLTQLHTFYLIFYIKGGYWIHSQSSSFNRGIQTISIHKKITGEIKQNS